MRSDATSSELDDAGDLGGLESDSVGALDELGRGLEAIEELMKKPLRQIQEETAYAWAWRAWAAYTLAKRASNVNDIIKWRLVATELEHESYEHAALVDDGCRVLKAVRRIVARAKKGKG